MKIKNFITNARAMARLGELKVLAGMLNTLGLDIYTCELAYNTGVVDVVCNDGKTKLVVKSKDEIEMLIRNGEL